MKEAHRRWYMVEGAEDSVYVGGEALGFLDIIDEEDTVTS